jgi:hypothetical protein
MSVNACYLCSLFSRSRQRRGLYWRRLLPAFFFVNTPRRDPEYTDAFLVQNEIQTEFPTVAC